MAGGDLPAADTALLSEHMLEAEQKADEALVLCILKTATVGSSP